MYCLFQWYGEKCCWQILLHYYFYYFLYYFGRSKFIVLVIQENMLGDIIRLMFSWIDIVVFSDTIMKQCGISFMLVLCPGYFIIISILQLGDEFLIYIGCDTICITTGVESFIDIVLILSKLSLNAKVSVLLVFVSTVVSVGVLEYCLI